jgi:hypothetical protein
MATEFGFTEFIIERPTSRGFVIDGDPQLHGVQRRPTGAEQTVIDDYIADYSSNFQRPPHGIHFIPFPGKRATVAVFLPAPE